MPTYLYSYSSGGHRYSLELPADSKEEADQRLAAIKLGHVIYDGELVAQIPAFAGAGLFVRLATRLRNFWVRK